MSKHDYKCQCGKPAKINYQLVWISWEITDDGDFKDMEFHNTDENEFWCHDCWNKEMGIK